MTVFHFRHIASAKLAATVLTGLVGVGLLSDVAHARSNRDTKREDYVQSRQAGPPVMAIVSLSRQRVTVYDAEGWIMRAPVSSGQSGYETPAGIYSILQRKVEHFSNLYDDAAMPFMQRLTWSGIALHAGALPGYPASHGCVRMPHDFAESLFGITRLGMRVIVMRDDIAPVDISHPLLFKPALGDLKTAAAPTIAADTDPRPVVPPYRSLRRLAVEKAEAAELASKRLEEARLAAAAKYREAARANKTVRLAQSAKLRAEAYVREMDRRLAATADAVVVAELENAKVSAAAKVSDAHTQLEAVQADVQPTLDEVAVLRAAVLEAQKAKTDADEEARIAKRKTAPISVFISRATQRLYVRQAFEPLFESPVSISNPDEPLGTYVFTALAFTQGEADLRWNAVSMYAGHGGQAQSKNRHHASAVVEPQSRSNDVGGAQSALSRISIPEDVLERISALISPGSAFIVSDEPLSRETGPATEFIVVMSTEPQGGIKIRRREPEARSRYQRFMRHAPYGQPASFW